MEESVAYYIMKRATQYLTFFQFVPLQMDFYINMASGILCTTILCGLTYMLYSFSYLPKGVSSIAVVVGFGVSFSLSTLLYIPLLGTLLLGIKCNYEAGSYVASIDASSGCMNGSHLMLFFICLFAILALSVIVGLYKAFIFNPSLSFEDPSACLSPNPSITFHFVRTLLLLLTVYGSLFAMKNAMAILNVIIQISFFLYRFKAIGVYYEQFDKFSIVVSAFASWIAVMNVFVCYLGDIKFAASVIGGIFECGAGVIVLVLLLRKGELFKTVESDESDRSKVSSCISRIRICSEAFSNSREVSMNTIMYYSHHYTKCKFQNCPITAVMSRGHSNFAIYRQEIVDGMFYSVNRQLKKRISVENPNAIMPKLFFISYVLAWSKKHMFAWEIYKKLKTSYRLSYIDLSILYFHKQGLEKAEKQLKANKSSTSEMQPLEILEKLKLERRLKNTLREAAMEYGAFWELFNDPNPRYGRFIAHGSNVIKCNKLIRSIWKELCTIRGSISALITKAYSLYCREVLFDRLRAVEINMRLPTEYDNEIRTLQFEEASDAVIAVSALVKCLGRIVLANDAVCTITGYTKSELRVMQLSTLIPKMYREQHEMGFEAECYRVESSYRFSRKSKDVFILTKAGYIVPVDLIMVDGPNLLSKYCFIGKIKQKKILQDFNSVHILTGPDRIIKNISSSNLLLR